MTDTGTPIPAKVAFVGFGEAAMAFVNGWGAARPARVAAYDIKPDLAERYAACNVAGGGDAAGAIADSTVVFCVVTADQALAAAQTCAPFVAAGALWLDCNSCSPQTKRAAAAVIKAAGGRYVDVAVMAPVHPKRHHVPLLVSGPDAEAASAVLLALDMKPRVMGGDVGQASTIKMLRSVMVKGMEALSAECFLTARRAGVDADVLASLAASDPVVDWGQRTSYNLERMMVHGARRAAEMHEVAKTVAELDLPNAMSAATARWQQVIADLAAEPGDDGFESRLDAVLSRLGQKG